MFDVFSRDREFETWSTPTTFSTRGQRSTVLFIIVGSSPRWYICYIPVSAKLVKRLKVINNCYNDASSPRVTASMATTFWSSKSSEFSFAPSASSLNTTKPSKGLKTKRADVKSDGWDTNLMVTSNDDLILKTRRQKHKKGINFENWPGWTLGRIRGFPKRSSQRSLWRKQ